MPQPEIEVHSADLAQIGSTLDGAGSALFGQASALDIAPDAGRSSGELVKALTSLATAVAGLSAEFGELAESTGAVDAMFTETDLVVGEEFTP